MARPLTPRPRRLRGAGDPLPNQSKKREPLLPHKFETIDLCFKHAKRPGFRSGLVVVQGARL